MKPEHAAAHQIAKHLRGIAALMPLVQSHAASAVLNHLLQGSPFETYAKRIAELNQYAEELEDVAPFEPITEEQRIDIREEYADSIGDLTRRERADLLTEDWTEAEWRMEQDDRDDYMRDDLEARDPPPGVGV